MSRMRWETTFRLQKGPITGSNDKKKIRKRVKRERERFVKGKGEIICSQLLAQGE